MTIRPVNSSQCCPMCGGKMIRYPGYRYIYAGQTDYSAQETTFLNCPKCQPELTYDKE